MDRVQQKTTGSWDLNCNGGVAISIVMGAEESIYPWHFICKLCSAELSAPNNAWNKIKPADNTFKGRIEQIPHSSCSAELR